MKTAATGRLMIRANGSELEKNRAQIQRIAHSRVFRTSEIQRNLLVYLADKSLAGTAYTLKEYTIGLDVFGKPASYDPKQESVVRMHVARLRNKIAEYYRFEGVSDGVFVDLPRGKYEMTFASRPATCEQPAIEVPSHRRERILAICLVVLTVCAAVLGLRLRQLQRTQTAVSLSSSSWTPEIQQLWAPLLSSNRRLMVCLSIPLFIRVPGFGFVRDASSSNLIGASAGKPPPSLNEVLHGSGAEPTYAFTGIGTATGAFLLGKFLAPHKHDVLLTRSDLISMPEIAMDNVVFLGPVTGKQIEAIPQGQEFVLEQIGIRNLKPRPGEPVLWSDHAVPGSPDLQETYALITQVPGLYGQGQILYFSGNGIPSVMAAVQTFTDPVLARKLVARLKGANSALPHSYQVVLKIRSMDDMPIEISYDFHHEL